MSAGVDRVRAFFAIELPDGVRGWINGELIKPLSAVPARVRWVAPKNIHLTLRFLGEVSFRLLGELMALVAPRLSELAPARLRLARLGTFGGRSPRVVWVGVEGDLNELCQMHDVIERSCREVGLPPEDKNFSPHLTIGRVKSPAHTGQLLAAMKKLSVKPLEFVADEVILFKSTLTPQGSIYEVIERFRLGE